MCKNSLGESPAAWSKSIGIKQQMSDRRGKLRENLGEKEV